MTRHPASGVAAAPRRFRWRPAYLPYLAAAGLSVLYALGNLHFLQQHLDWDQVDYSRHIESSLAGEAVRYHPHHLHLDVGGKHFHRVMVQHLGHAGFTDLVFNNRLRALLTACVGLTLVLLLLTRVTGSLGWGLTGALLVAVLHGYLLYATKVDTAIYTVVALLAVLFLAERLARVRRGALAVAALLGLAMFLAVMSHQMLAIACVVTCLVFALPAALFSGRPLLAVFDVRRPVEAQIERSARTRWLATVGMALLGVALIAAAYFYVGRVVYRLSFDRPNPAEARGPYTKADPKLTFQRWMFHYAVLGGWGKGIGRFDPLRTAWGWTSAFVSQASLTPRMLKPDTGLAADLTRPASPTGFVQNQLAYFALAVSGLSLLLLGGLLRRHGRFGLVLVGNLVAFTLAAVYWEPHYVEFWIPPSVLLVLLAVLVFDHLARLARPLVGRALEVPLKAYVLALATLFLVHNSVWFLVPYSRVEQLEDLNPSWSRDYSLGLFSRAIYRHPGNVYQTVYGTRPGEAHPGVPRPTNKWWQRAEAAAKGR
ncbi:MAG: hypothetical protein IT371_26095 [Deltaproteobacteria bacterium]|nr:hypothetical protein [Deltaproteobacteria bacterium]